MKFKLQPQSNVCLSRFTVLKNCRERIEVHSLGAMLRFTPISRSTLQAYRSLIPEF
jgi:hypothetical protein